MSEKQVKDQCPVYLQEDYLQEDQRPIYIQEEQAPRNWTIENSETVIKWQKDLEYTSFIYTDAAELYAKYVRVMLLITAAGTGVSAVIASLNIVLFQFNCFTALLVFLIIATSGSVYISAFNFMAIFFSWEEKSQLYSEYSARVFSIWKIIETELKIPEEQRIEAKDFMKRIYDQYLKIKNQCPYIPISQASKSEQKYKNNIFENVKWNSLFNKRMSV